MLCWCNLPQKDAINELNYGKLQKNSIFLIAICYLANIAKV